jgi:hypothetical protein
MGKNHFFFIFHASVILQYYYSMCVTFSFILGHGTPFIQSHSTHQQHQMLLRPRDHCTPMMKTLSKHENEVFTCIYLFLWKSFSFFYWFETFLRPRTSFKWLKSTVAKSTDLLGKTDSREVKIEKYCQVSCNQRIKRNIFFSFLLFLDYPDKFPNENHDTSI